MTRHFDDDDAAAAVNHSEQCASGECKRKQSGCITSQPKWRSRQPVAVTVIVRAMASHTDARVPALDRSKR